MIRVESIHEFMVHAGGSSVSGRCRRQSIPIGARSVAVGDTQQTSISGKSDSEPAVVDVGTGHSVNGSPKATAFRREELRRGELLELYRKMLLIRRFEEACGQQYSLGRIRGFLHLYIGQEATGVGAMSGLAPEDYVVTHYRDHGHALARGLDTNRMMAEMFGKRTGLSKGKGGSMHIFDVGKRFMGGHAIVGAQLPLAAGIALAQQYKETGNVTVVFFGDGAVNQGTFHETLNLASVWQLPVLFFMENNLYGMGSAVGRVRTRGGDFTDAMAAYDVDGFIVDGMDVLAVKSATEHAMARIRDEGAPVFLEAKTFRYVGHSYADPGDQYRERSEVDAWRSKDPVRTFPNLLVEKGAATQEEVDNVADAVTEEIEGAIQFALDSPEPNLEEVYDDVYAA